MPPEARNASQITIRARRKPQTSAMQSLRMYEMGKRITAPGRLMPQPSEKTLVAKRLEVMRQTTSATVINKKLVENLIFIFAVFIVVPVTLEAEKFRFSPQI